MEETAMTAQVQQVQQVEQIRSELASELAAGREQQQAKCTAWGQLQETLMEERIEKRMGILDVGGVGASSRAGYDSEGQCDISAGGEASGDTGAHDRKEFQ